MLHGDFYPHPVKDTYWQFLNELTYFRFTIFRGFIHPHFAAH